MIIKACKVKSQALAQGLAVLCGALIYNTSMAEISSTMNFEGKVNDTACVLVEADTGAPAGNITVPDTLISEVMLLRWGTQKFLLRGCPIRPITITLSGSSTRYQGTLVPSNQGQPGAASGVVFEMTYAIRNDSFQAVRLTPVGTRGTFALPAITPDADGTVPFALRAAIFPTGGPDNPPARSGAVTGILDYLISYN